MTQTDFQAVRNVLRWAGIGAMVSAQRIDDALRAVNALPHNDAQADSVRSALMGLRTGTLLSQRDCRQAERSLEIIYQNSQDDTLRETPRA